MFSMRVRVVQETALTEEQQMPNAAHPRVEVADLREDVVGGAGEHRVGVHELLHRRGAVVDRVALPVLHDAMRPWPRLQHRHVGAIEL